MIFAFVKRKEKKLRKKDILKRFIIFNYVSIRFF